MKKNSKIQLQINNQMSNLRGNQRKLKRRVFRKGNQRVPLRHFNAQYCLDGHSQINNWDFIFLSNMKHVSSLTKEKAFRNMD